MKIFKTIDEFAVFRKTWQGSVGFVPTMGHLHQGHLSLLKAARQACDLVVLSIFINPTQFNNPQDLANYPQTIEQDLEQAKAYADVVLLPDADQIYPDGYRYQVHEDAISKDLEGAFRPGHFDGVLTVVLKLFNIVKAHRAYFGEKDFQQYTLIKDMAQALFIETEVIACPTVREQTGLAMSSRNSRLSPQQQALAPKLVQAMRQFDDCRQVQGYLEDNGFKVDYIKDKDGRRFGAAFLGDVRLIDNIPLSTVGSFHNE